ncbi:MAG TPA: helix-turn-helix domain-containing protein [Solirubrobacterales bacterium]|nr:helix-turn-helix domain-containing protein [Solirubrobacterales bacterium]
MKRDEEGIRPSEVANLVNHELVVAAGHPTRVKALGILKEADASAGEIAKRIGRTAKHVKYHLDQLQKVDLVEIVEERSVYGGRVREKVFRRKNRPFMDQEKWLMASEDEQIGITAQTLELVSADVTEALLANTVNWPGGPDAEIFDPNHISRMPLALDRQGWNEIVDLLKATMLQAITINEQAAERGVESGEELIRAQLAILQFRVPKNA